MLHGSDIAGHHFQRLLILALCALDLLCELLEGAFPDFRRRALRPEIHHNAAEILLVTGRQTAQVMFIIAGAGIFGWVLIQQQIPNQVIEDLLAVSGMPWVILLMVNIILLILGIQGRAEMVHRDDLVVGRA